MLSSIGRAAIKRLVSTPITTSCGRIVVSQLSVRSLGPGRTLVRGFAAAAKPKTAAATTTKRATKPAATAGRTKKATTAKATKKPTKTTKATKATKATTAKKTKKKAAKPKTKPKLRRPKALSPVKAAILERKQLKQMALFTEPKQLPSSPWLLYVTEGTQGKAGGPAVIRTAMGRMSTEFKALPAARIQQLAAIAERNKVANEAAYKAWVESHTPQQTVDAMKARRTLKRKYNFPKAPVKVIHDDRLPKKPNTAYSLFTKARWASGDFATKKLAESSKAISEEWKSLPDVERHSYLDLAGASREQYATEVGEILHRPVYKRPSPKV
ncbi:hypothetical protein F4804DRAFT_304723 [Jackrogersella minutella]|nr:hypothetical protein F4804DRAFT_304723 [Jackrogersella minutella]